MKRLIACALIVLSFSGCKHGGPHYLLRLKYNKGVQTDLECHTYIVSDDAPNDPVTNGVVRMGFKVDSVMHDSVFRLSAKVDYIRAENNSEFGLDRSRFDSEDPPQGQDLRAQRYNLLIKPLIDSPLSLTINNKGFIVKPFMFLHGKPLPTIGPLDYELCQIHFPADSVATGEKWTDERSDRVTGEKWASNYYIEGVKDSIINIKLYGEIHKDNKVNKFTGSYTIAQQTGALISGKIEVVGGVSFKGMGKMVIDITSREWGFQ